MKNREPTKTRKIAATVLEKLPPAYLKMKLKKVRSGKPALDALEEQSAKSPATNRLNDLIGPQSTTGGAAGAQNTLETNRLPPLIEQYSMKGGAAGSQNTLEANRLPSVIDPSLTKESTVGGGPAAAAANRETVDTKDTDADFLAGPDVDREEKKTIQGKLIKPIQRLEEEEPLQGKGLALQRSEEEELLQGKGLPAQRAALEEDEMQQ